MEVLEGLYQNPTDFGEAPGLKFRFAKFWKILLVEGDSISVETFISTFFFIFMKVFRLRSIKNAAPAEHFALKREMVTVGG